MSRWRPPQPKSSPYITAEGYAALEREQTEIWARRREVTKHLTAAAAEGDRSENAEYIYRKKELREIDRRIRYLQKRLPELKVSRQIPGNPSAVYFAAWVKTETADGETRVCRIVGADEIDTAGNHISIDSPLARALLGKTVGDVVNVTTPRGETEHEIVAVNYDGPPE